MLHIESSGKTFYLGGGLPLSTWTQSLLGLCDPVRLLLRDISTNLSAWRQGREPEPSSQGAEWPLHRRTIWMVAELLPLLNQLSRSSYATLHLSAT